MSLLATRKLRLPLIATLLTASACGGDGDSSSDASSDASTAQDAGVDTSCGDCEPVSVTFRTQSGAAAVDCEHPVTVAGQQVNFTDIRYYVSEVELMRSDGTTTPLVLDTQTTSPGKPAYQGQQVALLDFENGQGSCQNGDKFMNDTVVGRAKPGTYTGIAFTLGVPEALNHLNVLSVEAPLNVMSMYWFWLSGYMFTALDFQTVVASADDGGAADGGAAADASADADAGASASADAGVETDAGEVALPSFFKVHLGSAGCSGNPSKGTVVCTRPNRARITLTDFDAEKNAVVLDMDALVKGRDVTAQSDQTPGCMSDPDDADCNQIFENLAVDPASGTATNGSQKSFRVDVK